MTSSSSSMAMSLMAILRESLKIPLRNGKLMLSIALFLLIPSSLLFLSNHFTLKPSFIDAFTKAYIVRNTDLEPPEYVELLEAIKKDVGIIVSEETIFILASCTISFFSTIALIYAAAAAYCWEEIAPKELFVLIRRMWKRPALTWSYVALFNLGYLFVGASLIGVLVLFAGDPVLLIGLGGFGALFFVFMMYLYLSVFWRIGLVVSVVEKDCYGMGAIWKAGELMKGRKLQGFCLSLVLTLVEMVICVFLGFQMEGVGRTEAARLGMGLALISATGLVDLFACVVYTVFYCDCKNGIGEKVEIERAEWAGYSLISTNCHVDTSIL
ncbi:hypothetical protein AAC387_Pa04g0708 [Persea americana]